MAELPSPIALSLAASIVPIYKIVDNDVAEMIKADPCFSPRTALAVLTMLGEAARKIDPVVGAQLFPDKAGKAALEVGRFRTEQPKELMEE